MYDQWVGRAIGIFSACDCTALKAVFCVINRVLVGSICLGKSLHTDAKARFVHHCEHRPHAFVLFAQKVASRVIIIHHTGGIAVDAHFLFDRANSNTVTCTQRAIIVHIELWHDKQRHTFDPFWATLDLGQNQVNDVFCHVVFTRRDEYLLTCDLERTVLLRNCFRAHQAKVCPAMRFSEVHCARPFARHHVGQIFVFLRVCAVR